MSSPPSSPPATTPPDTPIRRPYSFLYQDGTTSTQYLTDAQHSLLLKKIKAIHEKALKEAQKATAYYPGRKIYNCHHCRWDKPKMIMDLPFWIAEGEKCRLCGHGGCKECESYRIPWVEEKVDEE